MDTLKPALATLDPWAEPLLDAIIKERDIDTGRYVREIRGDERGYTIILTHRDADRGIRGAGPAPGYEIEIDRATRTVTRVRLVR